jgi:hypothetical protein
MNRIRFPLSLLAVAVLAGCASIEPGSALGGVQSLDQDAHRPVVDGRPL